jgi:hypothetical protein
LKSAGLRHADQESDSHDNPPIKGFLQNPVAPLQQVMNAPCIERMYRLQQAEKSISFGLEVK